MKGKAIICIVLSMALVLASQAVMAGTRVYVNMGVPAMQFEVRGGGHGDGGFTLQGSYCPVPVAPCYERVYVVREVHPRPQRIWVEGHYRWERPHRIWVPGHWEREPQIHKKDKPEKYWNKPGRGKHDQDRYEGKGSRGDADRWD